ncbi:hypothetical protein CI1B_61610 [Bradyrhizobium ivorense]|uniref:Uncharacterized protein n=1 Tax=Bradyrhizobium ivorense TaxID=2511166 RepID=A0A508TNF2_9BRAD|nr:hypothetical protein CI1B_61610 [Bradyrhizobium ivorense]
MCSERGNLTRQRGSLQTLHAEASHATTGGSQAQAPALIMSRYLSSGQPPSFSGRNACSPGTSASTL